MKLDENLHLQRIKKMLLHIDQMNKKGMEFPSSDILISIYNLFFDKILPQENTSFTFIFFMFIFMNVII